MKRTITLLLVIIVLLAAYSTYLTAKTRLAPAQAAIKSITRTPEEQERLQQHPDIKFAGLRRQEPFSGGSGFSF